MLKRIVLKFGSGILTRPRPRGGLELDPDQFDGLVAAVAELKKAFHACIVVSSGAVAAGLPAFGLRERPKDLTTLQACAAVGQTRLMHYYETLFRVHGLNVAQLLLTHEDLQDGQRRCNFRNTLEELLKCDGVVPIINENDSVAVEELKYGDNDLLSADVACLARAETLVLLTTVDGLLPPGKDQASDIIRTVDNIENVLAFARDEKGPFSVGGMHSKLRAVQRAVESGIEAYIANGRRPGDLSDVLRGHGAATHFPAMTGGRGKR